VTRQVALKGTCGNSEQATGGVERRGSEPSCKLQKAHATHHLATANQVNRLQELVASMGLVTLYAAMPLTCKDTNSYRQQR
jgi:hypothetical protein